MTGSTCVVLGLLVTAPAIAQPKPRTLVDRTPRAWTLGKTTCVKTLGGRGGPVFERC